MQERSSLPRFFCWTRFGTEAGEAIEAILDRKERERRENGGTFFWGIGNSVAPGIAELLRRGGRHEVLFSPITTRPRLVDVHPPALTRWRSAVTLTGERISLPEAARITSGHSKGPHYALVCARDEPLRPADLGRLHFGALRNLVSGNPLGASQVTAVVKRLHDRADGRQYVVALRATLAFPYFLRLADPVLETVAAPVDQVRAA